MIPRYSNKKISSIWTDKNRYEIWLQIEVYICEKLCIDKKITKKDFLLIKNKSKIDVNDIQKLDEKTHHEVIAFLNSISKKVGKSARYIHQGITSSDIIDTAFSLQLKQATEIILSDLNNLLKVLKIKAKKYKNTICLGRTHGIHAEPTSFGLKIASFYAEMGRNLKRLKIALEDISVCAISGAVGTYATINPSIEKFVAKKLGLKPEKISTQSFASLINIFGKYFDIYLYPSTVISNLFWSILTITSFLSIFFIYHKKRKLNENERLKILSIGIITIFLFYPRVLSFDLFLVVPVYYFLVKEIQFSNKKNINSLTKFFLFLFFLCVQDTHAWLCSLAMIFFLIMYQEFRNKDPLSIN